MTGADFMMSFPLEAAISRAESINSMPKIAAYVKRIHAMPSFKKALEAKITKINGSVQLIRDGFFLPAQAGMVLLPGDRVLSDAGGKAVIEFTGVKDALIIENGAAATFNLEVVEMDEAPQWIATDLYGQG
eukprot:gene3931-5636_t